MAFYRDASLKQSIKVGTAVVVVIDDDDDEDVEDDDDALSKKVACCAHMCFHQTNKFWRVYFAEIAISFFHISSTFNRV